MWKTRTRESFLNYWAPVGTSTTNQPFRKKWVKQGRETGAGLSGSSVQNWVFPLVDEIVIGLAIPEETIKGKDVFPHAKFLYIQEAMEDLVEYVLSGRFRSNFLSEEGILDKEIAILRIAREEGVDVDRFTFE